MDASTNRATGVGFTGTTAVAPPGITLAGKAVTHDNRTAVAGRVEAAEGDGVTEAVAVLEAGIDFVGDLLTKERTGMWYAQTHARNAKAGGTYGLGEAPAAEGDALGDGTAIITDLESMVFG